MRLSAITLIALLPLAAQAQGNIDTTYVDCTGGTGCRCTMPDVTAAEVAVVLGEDAINPDASDMILLRDGSGLRWSRLTPDQADATYGGDGVCPIELFPPVVPQDGMWVGTVRTSAITGCPAQFDKMIPAMTADMVISKKIAWNGRFDPALFSSDPDSPFVAWEELSPNIFSGALVLPSQSDALTVDGRLSASLTSEEAAVATMRLRIGMGGNGAAGALLASAGLADCRVTAQYDFRRTGP